MALDHLKVGNLNDPESPKLGNNVALETGEYKWP